MAGGEGWKLKSKNDEYESWKKTIYQADGETIKEVQCWRRLVTTFEIYRRVHSSVVELGPGELGNESGTLSCLVGQIVHTRMAAAASFVCLGDGTAEEQDMSAYLIRTQKWVRVGEDVLYKTETPAP